MLPSFHGLANEDPLTFIHDFHHTIQTFPLQGLSDYQLRMRCILYKIKDEAKVTSGSKSSQVQLEQLKRGDETTTTHQKHGCTPLMWCPSSTSTCMPLACVVCLVHIFDSFG
ncbi:hypothetical protein ACOSQ4_004320 [Xanthoceras sorbifolium]